MTRKLEIHNVCLCFNVRRLGASKPKGCHAWPQVYKSVSAYGVGAAYFVLTYIYAGSLEKFKTPGGRQ